MAPVRLGLVGCGRIVQLVHLKLLTRLPGAELVALAEPDERRRSQAARLAPGARAVAGYEEVVAWTEVDAVVICLPNALHARVAAAALQAGKHVYLEKPIATHCADAERVVSLWRGSGLVGMMGFNYRFNALYQAAREAIRSGRIGTPVSARSVFSSAARALPQWQQERKSGGGVLLNLGSHHFDLVHFLFASPVREVSAQLRSQRSRDDSAAVQLRLADDTLVQSFFSMNTVQEDRFEVYGDAGKLVIDRYRGGATVEISAGESAGGRLERLAPALRWLAQGPSMLRRSLAPAGEPSYRAALQHFINAVRAGRPASPDLTDGYRSLMLVEAAEESAATGRTVALPEPAGAGGADRPRREAEPG